MSSYAQVFHNLRVSPRTPLGVPLRSEVPARNVMRYVDDDECEIQSTRPRMRINPKVPRSGGGGLSPR
jgi:hypothetical protein